jgi:ATP-dependent helicase HrpB
LALRSEAAPDTLPIDALIPSVLQSVKVNPITLLQAEPGAGKTTRVPPGLLEAGFRQVIVLEPRRLAARMAARRVASERGEPLGNSVGYQVRFEKQGSAGTRLWFVTEGVLTRRLVNDPDLRGIDAVVLDEFHERHLETDVALALLLRLQQRRTGLRLLLMSATLDTESLQPFLGDAPGFSSPGRQHPIEIRHKPYSSAPLEQQVADAVGECLGSVPGYVLVFLPGAAEIRRAMAASAGIVTASGAKAYALHGDLSPEEQDQVVMPSVQRKVIFATNIAESSITIEGVRAVVDTGLARIASWSPWSGFAQLRVQKISRSSAIQRAGRAGRTESGFAVRLYSEEDFLRRPEQSSPEILRADLSHILLQLAAMPLRVEELRWVTQPSSAALEKARELLHRLGAIHSDGRITQLGRRMSSLPLHPRLARFVVEASGTDCARHASRIAARLSEGRTRLDELRSGHFASDLDLLLSADVSGNVRRLEEQIMKGLPGVATTGGQHILERSILQAFPDRVARKRGSTLQLSTGGSAQLDRASAAHSEFLCAIEIDERTEQAAPLVRIACPIEPDWLLELFPDHISTHESLEWNSGAQRAEQVGALLYDALVIDESRKPPEDLQATTELLIRKALEAGIERFADKAALDQLLTRVRFAQRHSTAIDADDHLIERALRQIASGLCSFSELKQACSNGAFEHIVESVLPMTLVNQLAPAYVRLPSGRRAPIQYSDDQAPWVSSRLQDFFGLLETPRVAAGAVPVVVHLLAPNQRPVQMTQDLASFWKTLYPQVRRELSRRYPKHKWPEDPQLV